MTRHTGREALTIAAVVVGNAAIQAALVIGDPVPAVDAWFVIATVASAACLMIAVWAVQLALSHRPPAGSARLAVTVVIAVIALAMGAIAWMPLMPILFALGAITLPAVAAGGAAVSGFRVFRRSPVRAALAVLAVIGLWGVGWLGALLLGFFVTGILAAFATWLVLGAAAVLGLALWTGMWERHGATPAGAAQPDVTRATIR